ncbi:MAG: flagellar protein [Roseburia sp.]|nr:flagellar protein [Roseburia sp.]
MDVRNCKGCNRLFQYIGGAVLCPVCKEELENKFQEVKEYIYNNKGASIAQVSENTGVSPKQIKQWIREDRLVLSEATADGITCEKCGTPIRSGRFCEQCKNKMVNEFDGVMGRSKGTVVEKKIDKAGNKMRFLS